MEELKDVYAGGILGVLTTTALELVKMGITSVVPSEYKKGTNFLLGLADLGIAGYAWTQYKKPANKMEEAFWGSLTLAEGTIGTLKTVPAIIDFALSFAEVPAQFRIPTPEMKLRLPAFG